MPYKKPFSTQEHRNKWRITLGTSNTPQYSASMAESASDRIWWSL